MGVPGHGLAQPYAQQRSNRLQQSLRGDRLVQESVGSGIFGSPVSCQKAEDQYRDIPGRRISLETAAEREPIELGYENFSDDDGGMHFPGELKCMSPVFCQGDGEAGLSQEVGLELANVGIPFDAENDGAVRAGAGRHS